MSQAIWTQRTLSVSLTGKDCDLACAHCNKRYLNSMIPIDNLEIARLKKKGITSLLISGGIDKKLKGIPYKKYIRVLEKLKAEGIKLNFHPNFHSFAALNSSGILSLVDRISYDLHLDGEVLEKVYFLDKISVLQVKATFESLMKFYPEKTVPHICMGLNFGKIKEEIETIKYLSSFQKLQKVIFIIFIPTPKTLMEKVPLVPIDEIEKVFKAANEFLQGKKLILGCMRPRKKEYNLKVESLALEYGFYAIVNPSIQKDKLAVVGEECCAF